MSRINFKNTFLKSSILLLVFGLSSCNTNKNKLNIKQFKLTKNALVNHEEVIVLACSENREGGKEDYLTHMLVQSVKTGDTVNVLFHGPHEVYGEDIKSFISPDDIFFKANRNKDFDIYSFKKVYSNPDYISIDWRKYPSIIGDVMTLYDTDDKSIDELIEDAVEHIKSNNN